MTSQELLQNVVAALAYRDSSGYVDGSALESSTRGFIWSDLRKKCGKDAVYFKGAVPVVAFVAAESRGDALQTRRKNGAERRRPQRRAR